MSFTNYRFIPTESQLTDLGLNEKPFGYNGGRLKVGIGSQRTRRLDDLAVSRVEINFDFQSETAVVSVQCERASTGRVFSARWTRAHVALQPLA